MAGTALILSGGGAKGDFQAGAIDQLFRMGMPFNHIGGVSVGALNGILSAMNEFGRMIDVWENIDKSQVLKNRGLFKIGGSYLLHKIGIHKPPLGYFSNSPLEKLITKNILGKRVWHNYYAGYVSDRTGNFIEHGIKGGGNFVVTRADIKRILASTAIPGVFDPVKIDGELYVDGGVKHVTPIGDALRNHDPDNVVIVTTRKLDLTFNNESKDIVDITKNSIEALMAKSFEVDIRRFLEKNDLVEQASKKGVTLRKNGRELKRYKCWIIEPEEDLGDTLDFSSEKAKRNIAHGREMARKAITI